MEKALYLARAESITAGRTGKSTVPHLPNLENVEISPAGLL